ncbi:MAG: ATP-dependent DNA helicase RecG [Candidatus Spechtbacteria bacterium RIFCSPLOWO2_01_FULL_46_10]|uniref:ATP-dependent DNA helicase RecG n=1 Tax=Candidatus Spechtbacteria bacterium RIFCSPLOWO2_01_FULL_46_10 TaxID=1802163 RepID=A0A1G2HE28_9BACT|nr:MAG: ATP-dependent DNA helicase RecG [Candidatus Spechtbacteria bacterium RIFCSPLOWO2_01_FULL_46_10]
MKHSTPVAQIARIKPLYAKRLKKLNIKEVADLLFHFPARYEDFSEIIPIEQVRAGNKVTVEGKVIELKQSRTWKKKMALTEAVVKDETSVIKAIWFNQPYLARVMQEGARVVLSGKAALRGNELYLSSPTHEIKTISQNETIHTGRLVPVYPETAGVSSRWFRYIISNLLTATDKFEDPLPKELRDEKKFSEINEALAQIHFPKSKEEAKRAKYRFAFEELLTIQLAALLAKKKLRNSAAPSIQTNVKLTKQFVSSLPYELTESQRKIAWRILKDMEEQHAMNRLLEGDVGSGKTVVAAIAALNAVDAGYQVAFMAPTEILAEQHYKNFTELFSHLNSHRPYLLNRCIELYTHSKKPPKNKRVDIAIGTHALIQKRVQFENLGLIVIDEQHRFGVAQRAELQAKSNKLKAGHVPHFLSMTATPIPRTLALTAYGDLDISVLREMPLGRRQIKTRIVPSDERKAVYEFIKKELTAGRQAFVIFPLIEESKVLDAKAAVTEFENLSKGIFKNYRLALLHGRMKSGKKEEIMKNFMEGNLQMLVSTSVVEVGIDVPNATVMIIENADRFGLAQLYQFRGRVGRGPHQSYCFLLTDSDSSSVRRRLRALEAAKNGFELAEYDLRLRGPGEIYGNEQSGFGDLATQALTDARLIEEVHEAAEKLLENNPNLNGLSALTSRVHKKQQKLHFE